MSDFTAIVKQDGDWWIGWIEEVPGVNCQESSRDALLDVGYQDVVQRKATDRR